MERKKFSKKKKKEVEDRETEREIRTEEVSISWVRDKRRGEGVRWEIIEKERRNIILIKESVGLGGGWWEIIEKERKNIILIKESVYYK